MQFRPNGRVLRQWDIRGKCDGLTADPYTGQVIATVNEDANSSLYRVDPWSGQVTHYSYSKPLPHHGGTDAISFYRRHDADQRGPRPATIGGGAAGPTRPDPGGGPCSVALNQARHKAFVRPLFSDGVRRHRHPNGPHFDTGDGQSWPLTDPTRARARCRR